MARLVAGNERYVSGFSAHPNNDLARRGKVAAGQAPFATILTCADSRVPPELLFDQGLGDLFVCRVAGNVVDDALLARGVAVRRYEVGPMAGWLRATARLDDEEKRLLAALKEVLA